MLIVISILDPNVLQICIIEEKTIILSFSQNIRNQDFILKDTIAQYHSPACVYQS